MNDFEHNGYRVYESSDGFEPGNGMFAVQSYIAVKDDEVYGFAFCISTIEAATHGFNPYDAALIQKARQTVTSRLDEPDDLTNREEYTFEYNADLEAFGEVADARWWNKTPR